MDSESTKQRGYATKVAPGITIRQGKQTTTIRIHFTYKGVLCRETLALPATKANVQYAQRLRGEILNAIGMRTFDYGQFFPESKRARLFGHVNANPLIGTLLTDFLHHAERTLARSTVIGYRKACHAHLFKTFGHLPVRELTPAFLRQWIAQLPLTIKALRNVLTPLRAVLQEAVNDDIILKNPLDRVIITKLVNKQTRQSTYMADPFTRQEINQLILHNEGQLRNLMQFAFFTGFRPSELLALRWEDVDLNKKILHVHRALVAKQEKGTKTVAGQREVLLLPLAFEALIAQKAYTGAAGQQVFHHPTQQKPWVDDQQLRTYWYRACQKAKVRYRSPYQSRHTYASMLLSAGENMLWAAKQMGHRDTEMIIKIYGKWIPQPDCETGYQPKYNWEKALSAPTPAPL